MKILQVRAEQVICEIDGKVSTRPNSPYYSLRYFHYKDKRIAYTFDDTSFVQETFNQRIFNCWCDGKRIQLRQDLSEKLAVAINHHIEFGNLREYKELFEKANTEIPNWEILDFYLRTLTNVRQTKIGFVIHDSFLIDKVGNAWVATIKADHELLGYHETDEDKLNLFKNWQSLCIVMSGHSTKAAEAYLPNEDGKTVYVNNITMTILTKVMFLLKPNMDDFAFTNQLSKDLQIMLNHIGVEVKV